MLLILETKWQVWITYQEVRLNAIYSASVIQLGTNLYFVLLKHTTSLKIWNIYLQIDFQYIKFEAQFLSAKIYRFLFFDIPA